VKGIAEIAGRLAERGIVLTRASGKRWRLIWTADGRAREVVNDLALALAVKELTGDANAA